MKDALKREDSQVPPADLSRRYEELRACAIACRAERGPDSGWTVIILRGVVAWMKSLTVPRAAANASNDRANASQPERPARPRAEMVSILAAMVLGDAKEACS